ncbi:hypothetical protein CEV32_2084 [Brucella rhizosphaerae]|uniref:Uncharacterized protein n=1 Tax=Brucella rhizosphaerae TaxID=571254 RepID=A0A256F4E9_9HYPH|nr:hypothetical protein CEV32_2084 [Brucella rhizosphaerae]
MTSDNPCRPNLSALALPNCRALPFFHRTISKGQSKSTPHLHLLRCQSHNIIRNCVRSFGIMLQNGSELS